MDLKEIGCGVNPEQHWYYQSKKIPLFNFFNRISSNEQAPLDIIDVGAGSGFFSMELLKTFPEKIGSVFLVDIGYSKEETAATKGHRIEKMTSVPETKGTVFVLFMDILEHIEDDRAMLHSVFEKLHHQVFFYITVPAFNSLWSSHDVFLEHHRRYTLRSLGVLLNNVPVLSKKYYLYGGLFPAAWLMRRIKTLTDKKSTPPASSNLKPLPRTLNGLLLGLCRFEMLICRLNLFFGITAVAEGRINTITGQKWQKKIKMSIDP